MKNDLIIDVGLHKGEDTEFYLKKGFRVLGIEANPVLYESAKLKFADPVRDGRLMLLNVAITPTDKPVTFYVNQRKTEWSTTSPDWVDRNERLGAESQPITVEGRRFARILEEFGIPYYLKIDIEGADLLCVEALREVAQRPRYVSIESSKTSWAQLLSEFRLFRELGYKRFKAVNQLDVERQTLPREPREGGYAEHRFCRGSSGAFGEEAPGRWLTEKEALRAYRFIFLQYRLFGDAGVLRTIDWQKPILWRFAGLKKWIPRNPWYDTHAALY